jgi:hypothetical protein
LQERETKIFFAKNLKKMDINALIGKSFEHHSFDSMKKHRWQVTRYNPETKYVYVERTNKDDKLGQWIPAAWMEHLLLPQKLNLKIDSLRKSRDYFKKERDELNERVVKISESHYSGRGALLDEMEFIRQELMMAEQDIKFWRSFSLYATISAVVLFGALLVVRLVFC